MKTWRIIAATLLAICAAQAARGDAMPSLAVVALDRIADGAFVTEAQVERACKALMAGLPEVAERYAPGTERLAKLLSARDEIAILALRMTARQDTDAAWDIVAARTDDTREAVANAAIGALQLAPGHRDQSCQLLARLLKLNDPGGRTAAIIDALAHVSGGSHDRLDEALRSRFATIRGCAKLGKLAYGSDEQSERVLRDSLVGQGLTVESRPLVAFCSQQGRPGARRLLLDVMWDGYQPDLPLTLDVAREFARSPDALIDVMDAWLSRPDADREIGAAQRDIHGVRRVECVFVDAFEPDALAIVAAEATRRAAATPTSDSAPTVGVPLASVFAAYRRGARDEHDPPVELLDTIIAIPDLTVARAAGQQLLRRVTGFTSRAYGERVTSKVIDVLLSTQVTRARCVRAAAILSDSTSVRQYAILHATDEEWTGGVRTWVASLQAEGALIREAVAESLVVARRAIELLAMNVRSAASAAFSLTVAAAIEKRDARVRRVRVALLLLEASEAAVADADDAFMCDLVRTEIQSHVRLDPDDGKTIKLYELVMGEAPKLVGDE